MLPYLKLIEQWLAGSEFTVIANNSNDNNNYPFLWLLLLINLPSQF